MFTPEAHEESLNRVTKNLENANVQIQEEKKVTMIIAEIGMNHLGSFFSAEIMFMDLFWY